MRRREDSQSRAETYVWVPQTARGVKGEDREQRGCLGSPWVSMWEGAWGLHISQRTWVSRGVRNEGPGTGPAVIQAKPQILETRGKMTRGF